MNFPQASDIAKSHIVGIASIISELVELAFDEEIWEATRGLVCPLRVSMLPVSTTSSQLAPVLGKDVFSVPGLLYSAGPVLAGDRRIEVGVCHPCTECSSKVQRVSPHVCTRSLWHY